MSYTVKDVSIHEYESFDKDGKKQTVREVCVMVDCSGNDSILMGTLDDNTKCYFVDFGTPEEILRQVGEKIRRDMDDKQTRLELLSTLKTKMIPIPKAAHRRDNLAPRTTTGASPVRPRQ